MMMATGNLHHQKAHDPHEARTVAAQNELHKRDRARCEPDREQRQSAARESQAE
jgi:hypothetical protein